MLEPLRTRRGHPDDTAEQFFTRRFGAEGARVLAGAFISGVYAGDARRLSAPAAFPLFWKFEQEHGGMIRGAFAHAKERRRLRRLTGRPRRRGLYSFRGGLGRLPAALAAGLGRRCRFAQPVKSVIPMERGFRIHGDGPSCEAAAVVVATPPRQAAAVLRDSDRRLADLLAGVPMAPVSTVHLGYGERLERAPEAFGFLAPRNEGVRVLGVLFASRLFEDRAPTQGDLFTAFFGGVLDQAALELADEQLSTIAQKELRRLLGIETPPVYVRTTRYPSAIPQLELGHGARVDEMSRRLANFSGLFLAGNYLRGVGIKDAAASGLEAARSVCDYFRRCSYQDVMAGTPGCPSFPGVSREQ
jgi:oxygen-dependent protoporphyrinogen oxidase